MNRNDYRLDQKQTLEAVRANRGTPAYQAMLEYLEAEVEVLKDNIHAIPDDAVVPMKHVIKYMKLLIADIKSDPRKRDEPQKTGGYTD